MKLYKAILVRHFDDDYEMEFEAESDVMAKAYVDEKSISLGDVFNKKLYLIGERIK